MFHINNDSQGTRRVIIACLRQLAIGVQNYVTKGSFTPQYAAHTRYTNHSIHSIFDGLLVVQLASRKVPSLWKFCPYIELKMGSHQKSVGHHAIMRRVCPSLTCVHMLPMTSFSLKLFIVIFCCAGIAWISGATGRMLVALLLLLFGPGYLFERAFSLSLPYIPLLRPALWIGLSLSLVGLLYTWTTALGIVLTPLLLGLLAFGCAIGVVWSAWYEDHSNQRGPYPRASDQRIASASTSPQDCTPQAHLGPGQLASEPVLAKRALALVTPWLWGWAAIFVLSLGVRFVQIHDLALPPWVDSVHHALLIRVAAEKGQAPYSLRPYLPLDNLPYHWGYHVFTATVMQLSGLTLPQVMLWSGQILNALHVLTCAALANYFWRRPLAGVVAALIVGLISIMPAYYVSWGRYTQLTGLLLLPAVAIYWHVWLSTPTRSAWISLVVLLAGLSVIHFRVLVLVLSLMAVIAAMWGLQQMHWRMLWIRLPGALGMALAAVGLSLPWLWQLAQRRLAPALHNSQALIGGGSYNELNEALLWAGQNRLLLALTLLAAGWGLFRRSRVTATYLGWTGAMIIIANPWLLGYLLPMIGLVIVASGVQQRQPLTVLAGGVLLVFNARFISYHYLWLITNDVIVISLFLPFAILIAGGVCLLYTWFEYTFAAQRRFMGLAVATLLALAALWGTWNSRSIINPVTVFTTAADTRAIAWIAEHTPPESRFLINATGWFSHIDRGSDGGWWIMPLTGRWTSTPPALYEYGPPDYVAKAYALSREIATFQKGQEQALYHLILREDITYIYLVSQKGPITTDVFANSPAFQTVYQQEGVTILEVKPTVLANLIS